MREMRKSLLPRPSRTWSPGRKTSAGQITLPALTASVAVKRVLPAPHLTMATQDVHRSAPGMLRSVPTAVAAMMEEHASSQRVITFALWTLVSHPFPFLPLPISFLR